ncbi:MAG: non-canonical purine NTP pyrophosphatase [Oceanicaulis sp.]|nr:non-canonical purine NTP pyrophosphatase [Oceanicaulis sp.]
MTLFSTAPKWAIASHNKGKIKEIADLIAPYGLVAEGADSLGLPEPEETEKTFTGNALLKARAGAEACGLVSLADDSGLEVTALDGAPVFIPPAGPESRAIGAAMDKVRTELEARQATDYSALCVRAGAGAPDGETRVYEGEVRGHLSFPPREDKGFGYDPIFVPNGHELTFAEMDPAIKHAMSHRAHAFRLLVEDVFGA